MGKISRTQVEEIAQLARLELDESEKKKFETELSNILDYVDTINKADTSKVEVTTQVTGLSNIVREDKKNPSIVSQEELLSNAPDKKDGYIKVKPVL